MLDEVERFQDGGETKKVEVCEEPVAKVMHEISRLQKVFADTVKRFETLVANPSTTPSTTPSATHTSSTNFFATHISSTNSSAIHTTSTNTTLYSIGSETKSDDDDISDEFENMKKELEELESRCSEVSQKIEALTNPGQGDRDASNEIKEMTRQVEARLSSVSAEIEKISSLHELMKKEQKVSNGLQRNGSTKRVFHMSSPSRSGCADVIGHAPLGYSISSGISKSFAQLNSVYERSLSCDPSIAGHPSEDGSGESKMEIWKFLRAINNSGLMDLKKYVLKKVRHTNSVNIETCAGLIESESQQFRSCSTEDPLILNCANPIQSQSPSSSSPPLPPSSSIAEQLVATSISDLFNQNDLTFNSSHVTLDTPVPCPHSGNVTPTADPGADGPLRAIESEQLVAEFPSEVENSEKMDQFPTGENEVENDDEADDARHRLDPTKYQIVAEDRLNSNIRLSSNCVASSPSSLSSPSPPPSTPLHSASTLLLSSSSSFSPPIFPSLASAAKLVTKRQKRTYSFNMASPPTHRSICSPSSIVPSLSSSSVVINPSHNDQSQNDQSRPSRRSSRRPVSSVLESFFSFSPSRVGPLSPLFPTREEVSRQSPPADTTQSPQFGKSEFRRAKSEVNVKRKKSKVTRFGATDQSNCPVPSTSLSESNRMFCSTNEFSMNSPQGHTHDHVIITDQGKPAVDAWRPKRKFMNVDSVESSTRPHSGCTVETCESEDMKFYNFPDIPYIDNLPETTNLPPSLYSTSSSSSSPLSPSSSTPIRPIDEPSSNRTMTSPAPDLASSSDEPCNIKYIIYPSYSSLALNDTTAVAAAATSSDTTASDSPRLTPTLHTTQWPASSAAGVTHRKKSFKLKSKWEGFRRAVSMVFDKNITNNNNNANNNNNDGDDDDDDDDCNCRIDDVNRSRVNVKKASSTNFIDGKSKHRRSSSLGIEVKDGQKKSKSQWDVWRRQSRLSIPEAFRKKYTWMRVTLKRKEAKGFKGSSDPSKKDANNDVVCSETLINGVNDDDFQPQIVIKSTLASVTDELMTTEHDYISSMSYVINNYLPLLDQSSSNASLDIPETLRGKRYVIFGNLEKIYNFHAKRFHESLLMCKGHPYALGSAFLRHESEFYLYALYSKNKPKSDALMEESGRKFFQDKQRELNNPMDLESYLLKPIQRLSKYALMLKKILQSCPLHRPEYTDIEAALEMVRFQLRHGEDLLAADCITGCDVNLQEQGMLIRRDDLLVTKGLKKCLRHVFLYEEIVVFTKTKKKPGRNDIYSYKNSLKTSDIGLTESIGEDGRQFEIWFRKRTASTSYKMQANSKDSKIRWTSDLTSLLWKQTQACRQKATAAVVMATGMEETVNDTPKIIRDGKDADSSRPVSFASSSSSTSSSNNSTLDPRTSSVSFNRNTYISSSSSSSASSSSQPSTAEATSSIFESSSLSKPARKATISMSSSSSSSSQFRPLSVNSSDHNSSSSSSLFNGSSSVRPLTFSVTPTKLGHVSSTPLSPKSFQPAAYPKLSPVKEQLT